MKLYLSHNFAAQTWLNDVIVPILTEMGYEINSRWLKTKSSDSELISSEIKNQYAQEDLEDVKNCNIFIHFSDEFSSIPGRGKFIEFGYAYANHKQIFVVGENQNSVFYHLVGVIRFKLFSELVAKLTVYKTLLDDDIPF